MHPNRTIAGIFAVCLVLAPLAQAEPVQQAPAPSSAQQGLDKLLAPIALYPDALLAQVLACATSPQQGEMRSGFGLIAVLAEYGNSGIMTFMVNQDGVVFLKDLGQDTEKIGAGISAFDPDSTWTKVH